MPTKKKTKPKRDDSFEAVAKRLGADEDKARFEAKLGKIAKAGLGKKAKVRKPPRRSVADQIAELERKLKATIGLSPKAIAERERIQRHLCNLQGIDFDAPDGLHEFD